MTTVEQTPEANAIAKIVADRCHGNRKPNQAAQRYAIIWQAARLGALEAMKQPALATIPDPLAFVQAARGMAEALKAMLTASQPQAVHRVYIGEAQDMADAALTAFRAATGEA